MANSIGWDGLSGTVAAGDEALPRRRKFKAVTPIADGGAADPEAAVVTSEVLGDTPSRGEDAPSLTGDGRSVVGVPRPGGPLSWEKDASAAVAATTPV